MAIYYPSNMIENKNRRRRRRNRGYNWSLSPEKKEKIIKIKFKMDWRMQRNRYVKDEASKVAKVKKGIKVKIKKKKTNK